MPFEEKVGEKDGKTWKVFKKDTRKDRYDMEIADGARPAFEDAMIQDLVKATRRDRKLVAKKRQ